MGQAPSVFVREAIDGDLARIAHIKVQNWIDTYVALVPSDALAPHDVTHSKM